MKDLILYAGYLGVSLLSLWGLIAIFVWASCHSCCEEEGDGR